MKWPAAKPTAKTQAIVAAGHEIDLKDWGSISAFLAHRERWQYECLNIYHSIGQLKDAADRFSDLLSGVDVFVAEQSTEPDEGPKRTENSKATAAFDRLRENSDGINEIIREIVKHGLVAGECNLVGQGKTTEKPERWWVASISEVEGSAPVKVLDPDDPISQKWIRLREDEDFIGRIWRRDMRYGGKADSPFRGILPDAEEYLIYSRALRATSKSRIARNGILVYNQDIEHAKRDEEDNESPLERDIRQAFLSPIVDEQNGSAVVPILVGVGQEQVENAFQYISLPRELDGEWLGLRKDALEHIAQGLPIPPEFLFGLSEATHWGAGQIEEFAFEHYFAPWATWAVNALTQVFLHPMLKTESGDDWKQYHVWFDAADLVVKSKQIEGANDAHERLAISDEYYRKIRDYPKDSAPNEDERKRRLEEQRLLRSRPSAHTDPTAEPVQAAATQPDDLGEILEQMDAALMSRMEGAAIMAEKRVMERAGSRIKTLAKKDKDAQAAVASVAPKAVAATLGRAKVASLTTADDLLTDAWDDLATYWETEVADLQADVLDRIQVDDPIEREQLTAAMERNRRDAWKWLEAQLSERAMNALYDNIGPVLPFVREAMGRAGQL